MNDPKQVYNENYQELESRLREIENLALSLRETLHSMKYEINNEQVPF